MFNLEQSISEWRQRMLAAGVKTPVPLEELELHLREEIERQLKAGRNEVEAFRKAVQTIGPADEVRSEFEKFEAGEQARKWRQNRIWSGIFGGASQLILIAIVLFNSEMNLGQRMSALAAIATSLLLVGVVALNHRWFPVIRDPRRRMAVSFLAGGIPAVIYSLIFARFFLVGHEFPFGQWLASALWTTAPPWAFYLGVIMGIETAARRKSDLVAAEVTRL